MIPAVYGVTVNLDLDTDPIISHAPWFESLGGCIWLVSVQCVSAASTALCFVLDILVAFNLRLLKKNWNVWRKSIFDIFLTLVIKLIVLFINQFSHKTL